MSMLEHLQPLLPHIQYLSISDIERVTDAYRLAEHAHGSQTRSSGEPYITHPVAVALILTPLRPDTDTLVAALLHDVIEDTPVTKEEIAEKFGTSVADLVSGLSKLDKLKFQDQRAAQAENYRKMILAMVQDIRVILIKLADRTHNMRTLGALRNDKRRRIALETLEIYAPLAHRLGIHQFKIELEELGFAHLYPNRNDVLNRVLVHWRSQRKELIGSIISEIRTRLDEESIGCHVYGREKSCFSIYQKMRNKTHRFDSIFDIYAFRIIVDSIDTCYRVLGLMHGLYPPKLGHFKDYIAIPKANGYQSLHTCIVGPNGVPVEIQIRTEDMDGLAERGIAAHWAYKTQKDGEVRHSATQLKAQRWMENLLELQHNTTSSLEFIENVKSDLFAEEIYIFTPQGRVIELPRGATAVDLAYALHTDLGNSCIGAKVNKKHHPLSEPLRNGQTVEIISTSGARPNPSWLNFIVTPLARSKIQTALKHIKDDESLIIGKRLLNNALGRHTIEDIPQSNIDSVLTSFKLDSLDHLYRQISHGKIMSLLVARRLMGDADQLNDNEESNANEKPLIIKGTRGIMLSLATCCLPIKFEPIVAHVSTKKGLTIHHHSCPHVRHYLDKPSEYMEVEWSDDLEQKQFKVRLLVSMKNEHGCLADITRIISQDDSSIYDIKSNSNDHFVFRAEMIVTVRDTDHLEHLLQRLKSSTRTLDARRIIESPRY